jgi:hypothetical protein
MDRDEFFRRYAESFPNGNEGDAIAAWVQFQATRERGVSMINPNWAPFIPEEAGFVDEAMAGFPGFGDSSVSPGLAAADAVADVQVLEGGGGLQEWQADRRGAQLVSGTGVASPLEHSERATLHPKSYLPDAFQLHHDRVRGNHVLTFGREPNAVILGSCAAKKGAAEICRAFNALIRALGTANPFSIQAWGEALKSALYAGSGAAGAQNGFDPPLQGQ